MQQAWDKLQRPATSTIDKEVIENSTFVMSGDGPSLSMLENAAGDLAALHLQQDQFIQALDIFSRGHLDQEAAYMAERVLTLDELKAHVDALPPPTVRALNPGYEPWINHSLHWILARRCVREDRYTDAAKYLPAPYQPALKLYVEALAKAANTKLPKAQRAQAYSTAAWICRGLGMELMGTEVEPDNFFDGGDFEASNIAAMRAADISKVNYDDKGEPVLTKGKPPALPASAGEKKRLAKNHPTPDVRFHYRHIAAALAWKAAALMPDQSDELADTLNTAGRWIKDRDEKGADRYFQAIERRASKTTIGKAAGATHWFVEDSGPWSAAKEALLGKLNADIEAAMAATQPKP